MKKTAVLVVEDDNLMAKIAETRLTSLGYSMCNRASTAAEAIEAVVTAGLTLSSWTSASRGMSMVLTRRI